MITVTSYDAVGERAHAQSCADEVLACDLIGQLDQYLAVTAPWAHRIDDLCEVVDSIEEIEVYEEPTVSLRVCVRAPRGTWADGQPIHLLLFSGRILEAEDDPGTFLVLVNYRWRGER